MEWPAAPQAGDLPSKEFNFSRGIKGTLALRDLFGLLAHLELTRAEQHYIVDLCLGLKGATKLYGLLGKGEKERGENPLLQRKKNGTCGWMTGQAATSSSRWIVTIPQVARLRRR